MDMFGHWYSSLPEYPAQTVQCQGSTAERKSFSAASDPIWACFWAPWIVEVMDGNEVGDRSSIKIMFLDGTCFASPRVRRDFWSTEDAHNHSPVKLDAIGPRKRPG